MLNILASNLTATVQQYYTEILNREKLTIIAEIFRHKVSVIGYHLKFENKEMYQI